MANPFEKRSLPALLNGNPYPGRGIAIGCAPDGHRAVLVYFIMGRSANSRNRIFEEKEQDLFTRPFDPSKVEDPSLIIYAPLRVLVLPDRYTLILTNGDQTDTIVQFLESGRTFEDALATRTFEPDAPSFTPRISGVFRRDQGAVSYQLSILKTAAGDPAVCQRQFFTFDPATPGTGHLIHTYSGAEDPLPSFEGDPVSVAIDTSFRDATYAADALWMSLDPQNKVSLFLRTIELKSGKNVSKIINLHSA